MSNQSMMLTFITAILIVFMVNIFTKSDHQEKQSQILIASCNERNKDHPTYCSWEDYRPEPVRGGGGGRRDNGGGTMNWVLKVTTGNPVYF